MREQRESRRASETDRQRETQRMRGQVRERQTKTRERERERGQARTARARDTEIRERQRDATPHNEGEKTHRRTVSGSHPAWEDGRCWCLRARPAVTASSPGVVQEQIGRHARLHGVALDEEVPTRLPHVRVRLHHHLADVVDEPAHILGSMPPRREEQPPCGQV